MPESLYQKSIGIFTLPRSDMSLVDGVRYVREMGLNVFEPFAGGEFCQPDRRVALKLRDAARAAEVTMPCLSVLADLGGEDREAQARRLIGFARLAAQMGVAMLHHTLIPGLRPPTQALTFEEALGRVVPLARRVYDEASAVGVRCVYEDQGTYFNGRKGLGAFLNALDRPAGVVLDLGNIAFVAEEIVPFAKAFADRIVHVHAKDYAYQDAFSPLGESVPDGRYVVPAVFGQGDMNVRGALEVLAQTRYRGYFVLEHSPVADGVGEQRQCVQNLSSMLRQLKCVP